MTLRPRSSIVSVIGLALLASAAACSATPTDPVGSDESDVTQVPGSSIGSAYVDPAKTYLNRRNIRNLYQASTLDRAVLQLAERIDGVIANKPQDGFVSVDELVAMEQAPQSTVLFPQEKAMLPLIWEAMTVGPVAPAVQLAGAPAGDTPLEDRITTQVTPPTPIVVTKMPIASLPYTLREVANRIQLAHDDDTDPTTISPADVATSKANPGPFTSGEVMLMDKIVEELRARGTSTASAKLVLPYDGVKDERYGVAGHFEIVRSRRLVLEETRQLGTYGEIGVQLAAQEKVDDQLLFDGTEAIVVLFSKTTNDEYLVGTLSAESVTRVPAGKYLAQVWQRPGTGPFAREGAPCATDGQVFERTCGKCGHAQAACVGGTVTAYSVCAGESPTCAPYGSPAKTLAGWFEIELGANHPPAYVSEYQRTFSLKPFVDYDVVTADGAPVAKWLGYSTEGGKAQWTFGPFDPDHVGDKKMSADQMTAISTPKPSLPVGRYGLDAILAGHKLDIHPSGVVFLTLPDGTTRRLLPVHADRFQTEAVQSLPTITLDAKTGVVSTLQPYSSYPKTTTLKPAARD